MCPQLSDDVYLGGAPTANTGTVYNVTQSPTLGVGPCGRVTYYDIVPLTIFDDNFALSQSPGTSTVITMAAGTGITKTGSTYYMDVPRNVRITSGGADTAMHFTVVGIDVYGQAMSEAITGATAGIAAGKKAFYGLTSVTPSGTVSTTVKVGTGDVFGLPVRVTDKTYITSAQWNNTLAKDAGTVTVADVTATATTLTGDVRGTYAPSSGASDGAKRLVVGIVLPAAAVSPTATRIAALGVTQA